MAGQPAAVAVLKGCAADVPDWYAPLLHTTRQQMQHPTHTPFTPMDSVQVCENQTQAIYQQANESIHVLHELSSASCKTLQGGLKIEPVSSSYLDNSLLASDLLI